MKLFKYFQISWEKYALQSLLFGTSIYVTAEIDPSSGMD